MQKNYTKLVGKFKLTTMLVCTSWLNVVAQDSILVSPIKSDAQIVHSKNIDLSKLIGETSGSVGTTQSGGVTYSIPINVSPGTNGIQPTLMLSYNSQMLEGMAGMGWNISGLSMISRTGKNMYHNGAVQPVTYTAQDAFLLDGTRLNNISGDNGTDGSIYAPEIENFSRVTAISNSGSNNPNWFSVRNNDGSLIEYGNSIDSKVITDDGQSTMVWRVNKISDKNGNYIEFKYDLIGRDSRIRQILYTGNSSAGLMPYNIINFEYESRLDANIVYEAGSSLSSSFILKTIKLVHIDDLGSVEIVRTYLLNYNNSDNIRSKLSEIVEYAGDQNAASLNSTSFSYGLASGQDITTNQYQEGGHIQANYGQDFFPGDFDADGKTDVLVAQYYNAGGRKFYQSYHLDKNLDNNGGVTMLYQESFSGHGIFGGLGSFQLGGLFSADYNKDGRDDVLFLTGHVSTDGQTLLLNNVVLNKTGSFNPNTGWYDKETQLFDYPNPNTTDGFYQSTAASGKNFITGDFDGDGNCDYILIAKNNVTNKFKAFFTSPSNAQVNLEIVNFGIGNNPYPGSYAQTISEADRVIPIDFDGDGKLELLITKNNITYVLKIEKLNPTIGYHFIASIIHTNISITKNCRSFPGDFNGDKKTDLLMRYDNNTWGILYSDGITYNSNAQAFFFQNFVRVNGYDVIDHIKIADFDGDGKSDILHGYNYFINGVATTSKLSIYYSKGRSASPFYYQQYDFNKTLTASNLLTGDFYGDGQADLLSSNPSQSDMIYIKPFRQDKLLTNITTGHNISTDFEYKLLTDKSTFPWFYNRTKSLDDAANLNPFNYVQVPIYAVSKTMSDDGIGESNITEFNYENAVVHRAAKGLLGFEKITSKNNVTGVTSISENAINTDFAVPYGLKEIKKMTNSGIVLAESVFENAFVNLSQGPSDKRFRTQTNKTVSFDYLTDKAIESNNTYDNFGNITSNTTNIGYQTGNNVTPVEIKITSSSFGIHNSNVPAILENRTVTHTRVGKPSATKNEVFNYDNLGRLISQVDFFGLPKAITSTITYDIFGNNISCVKSVNGLPPLTMMNSYESKGRFAIQKHTMGGSVIQTEYATYISKWGVPSTNTTSDCLTTSYQYDVFGRLVNTLLPDGNSVTVSKVWQVSGNNLFYSLEQSSGGAPDRKKFFDKWGKVWKEEKESQTSNSMWHTLFINYDSRGNVRTKSNLHFPGMEIPRITTYSYDIYNRAASTVNYRGTSSVTYTNLGAGNRKVILTGIDGNQTTEITDASGKTISSSDNGGLLSFQYDSQGNQTEVNNNGTIVINSTFDVYGMQSSITDIDAGTTTYEYDNFNRLVGQTDAKANNYIITYDGMGRTATRTGGEGTTSYEYFYNLANGCSNNTLKKVTGFNGVVREYFFDVLNRLQSEVESGLPDGSAPRTTSYTYDAYGALASTTFPSGVTVSNVYDDNGYLIKKTSASFSSSRLNLYYNPQIDGEGRVISYTLGNGKVTSKTYNQDFPASTFTPAVQNLSYTFGLTSGNLLNRQDVLKGQIENFTYDNLNRLTSSNVNNSANSFIIRYDGDNSNSMGNISAKSDVGYYKYQDGKKHAVAFTTQTPIAGQAPISPMPASAVSQDEQLISYTPFLKPSSIGQGLFNTGQGTNVTFDYGPDYERLTMQCFQSRTVENRYYAQDYEEQQIGYTGAPRNIHYISGGDGLCAILVKENGVMVPYYTYTDYLGSILTVTDKLGEIVANQNFDAWGRQRNSANWNQYVDYEEKPTWLYRGYTGHEMLPAFSLINMNGRLYDPVLGRMLSPDNYVSQPNSTQGYNRYSYANNNPLVFTDPDGNLPVIAIVGIFAAVHVSADLIRNNFRMNFGEIVGSAIKGGLNGLLATTGAGAITKGTSALIAAAAAELPGINIPIGDGFSIGISPSVAFGSTGWSYGANISVSARVGFVDVGFGGGGDFGKSSVTGLQGWTSRTSAMGGARVGKFSFGVGSSTFSSGITSQTTGMAYAGQGDYKIRYENDWMWKGAPIGDGGDRYRTTAATFSYKDYSLGLNLFTGDPGLRYIDRKADGANTETRFKGTYEEKNQGFRLGALYAGVGNYRFGANGEPIRNFVQNHMAHDDGYRFPLFQVMSTIVKPYSVYQTRNIFTSW